MAKILFWCVFSTLLIIIAAGGGSGGKVSLWCQIQFAFCFKCDFFFFLSGSLEEESAKVNVCVLLVGWLVFGFDGSKSGNSTLDRLMLAVREPRWEVQEQSCSRLRNTGTLGSSSAGLRSSSTRGRPWRSRTHGQCSRCHRLPGAACGRRWMRPGQCWGQGWTCWRSYRSRPGGSKPCATVRGRAASFLRRPSCFSTGIDSI